LAPVITIMGPIGSGKTAQAEMLAQKLGWVTFSTGQLIREDHNPEATEAGKLGKLAPTDYVQDLVLEKIKSIPSETGIILDGSPRMVAEAERLDIELPKLGRKIDLVIFLNADEPMVEQRLVKRGRHDDHPSVIQVRWNEYQRDTLPVVDRFRDLHLVSDIDGHGTHQQVNDAIIKVIHEKHLA
jgi:adenylate kinase